jgi:hypothetical protein
MLERTVEGSLRPLRFPSPGNALDGYYVSLPATQPYGRLAYGKEAPLDFKLAAELAAAMESIATTAGDDLNVKWTVPPSEGGGRLTESVVRYELLVRLLLATSYSAAAPVFQYLSESPYPNLRSAGIVGRLRGGDAEAAMALERDASQLADTVAMFDLSSTLMSFRWQDSLTAAHALARAALGETQLPGLESVVAGQVSYLQKTEFLPYLAVMLESPNTGNRDTALMGLCTILRRTSNQPRDFGGLWKPEMQQYCPNHSPLQDPAEERVYLDFWKQWWVDNREKIQADPNVPRPVAPARYFSKAPVAGERIPVPMTQRLQLFVNMAASLKRRREAQSGPSADKPVTGSVLGARLSAEDDRKLEEIALRISASLAATQEKSRVAMTAAAVQGARPDRTLMQSLNSETEHTLTTGLADLQRELSPAGWSVVEDYLLKMNITGVRLSAPTPEKLPAR